MGRVARPSALTPELREQIESDLEDGIPVRIAAENARVSKSTVFAWISAGYVVRRSPRPKPILVAAYDASAEDASSDLDQRLRAAEPGLVAALVAAAGRGSWQASAWLLERAFPERWGKPLARTGSAGERDPAFVDPFVEVDELAAARRRKLR